MLILSRLIEKICFQSVVQTIDVRGLFRLILSESCDFHLSTICYYSMPLALPFKAVQPPSSMLAHSLKPEAATSLFSLYGQPIELLLIFSNTKKKGYYWSGFPATESERGRITVCSDKAEITLLPSVDHFSKLWIFCTCLSRHLLNYLSVLFLTVNSFVAFKWLCCYIWIMAKRAPLKVLAFVCLLFYERRYFSGCSGFILLARGKY